MNHLRLALLVGVVVFGAKLALIADFGSESPYNDQWNSEGAELYLPILKGTWSWGSLFAPSNEHRILPTRLLAVAHFIATGRQWDPTLQLAISAAVFALWSALLAAWLLRITPAKFHLLICAALVIIGAAPFAFENTLWAFQNQFYFLLTFSAVAAWGLLNHSPKQAGWWFGGLAGAAAVVSMGSGGLVGAAILAVLSARWIARRRVAVADLPSAIIGTVLVAAMLCLRVNVAGHAKYAADSPQIFAVAFLRLAAWPFSGNIALAAIVWFPFILLLVVGVRAAKRMDALGETAVFLGSMVVLQMSAMAWARGTTLAAMAPSSRYTDILAIGLVANLVALIWFRSTSAGWPRAALAVWSFLAVTGIASTSINVAVDSLGQWSRAGQIETEQIGLVLKTGDLSHLRQAKAWDPSCPAVAEWIAAPSGSLAFVSPREVSVPGFLARQIIRCGFLILCVGGAALGLISVPGRSSSSGA